MPLAERPERGGMAVGTGNALCFPAVSAAPPAR